MEQIICIEIFILDILVWFLIKKVFGLKISLIGFLCTMLINLASLSSILFLESVFYLVLIRLAAAIIISLLITNDYNFKSILKIILAFIIISLSEFGYYNFLLLIAKNLNLTMLNSSYFNLYFASLFALFYTILYIFAELIKNAKKFKSFYAEVSFLMAGKHIKLKGLIDSGNSVYDTKSHLPVIFVSNNSLKKFMPLATMSYVSDVLASHYEKCVLVGGKTIYVPIVSVDNGEIIKTDSMLPAKFVVGVVAQAFYDERHFDCLLHRDFV